MILWQLLAQHHSSFTPVLHETQKHTCLPWPTVLLSVVFSSFINL